MSATECAKKILCRNKAQQLADAINLTLDEWDEILPDDVLTEASEVMIQCQELGLTKAMKVISDSLKNQEPSLTTRSKGKDGRDHF